MKSTRTTKQENKDLWIPMADSRLEAVDRGKFAVELEIDIRLRWLGVAGIELDINDQVLVIDPFFTRIPFWRMWFGRAAPDRALAEEMLPRCDFILVSHAHYDHLMDVPGIACSKGAIVYGSTNTCRILALYDVPEVQAHEITAGDSISFSLLEVEVLPAEHIPAAGTDLGPLPAGLKPPLGLRQYRMDSCFNFLIEAGGLRLLYCAGSPKPPTRADVLIAGTAGDKKYYKALLGAVKPSVFIPIQNDDESSSASKPVDMAGFKYMIEHIAPSTYVLQPEAFREYILSLERSHAFGRMLHIE